MNIELVIDKAIELAKTPGFSSFVTAAATLTGVYFGTVWKETRDFNRKRESIKRTIAAEIRLYLDLISVNKYVEEVSRITSILEAGGIEAIKVGVNDFGKVFNANLENLGYLEDAADLVVTFYGYCQSAITDLGQIWEICEGINKRSEPGAIKYTEHERLQLLLMHQALKGKLQHALQAGQAAIAKLG